LGRQLPTLPVSTPLASSHEALVRERFRENRMTPSDRGSTIQPPYDAVIFDMDGVVTDTASLHAKAWKQLFDQVLADPRADVVRPVDPVDPAHEPHREALTTLGNGYMGTRGAMPEHVDDGVRYPGTCLAGVYNRLVSTVGGEDRVDEALVNVRNWLPFDIAAAGSRCFLGEGITTTVDGVEV
jgi:hypothetical protein